MKEKEAIKKVKEFGLHHAIGDLPNSALTVKAFEMAVAALEKQMPKKPVTHKDTNRADCPVCGATVRGIKEPFGDWCSKCGQKLDWE